MSKKNEATTTPEVKQVRRFGDLETKAFPEVDDHRKIEDVRELGDIVILDHSEPMNMSDEQGNAKDVVIVLASEMQEDGSEAHQFTFAAGGVVMEKIQKAKAEGYLPLVGAVELVTGKNKRKYNDIV